MLDSDSCSFLEAEERGSDSRSAEPVKSRSAEAEAQDSDNKFSELVSQSGWDEE